MFDCACSTSRVAVVAAGALTVCQPEKGRSDADAPALSWVLLRLPEWQGPSDPRGLKAASTLRTALRDTLDSRRASQCFNSTWVSDLSRLRVGTKCCFSKIFFRDQVPNRACSFDFFQLLPFPTNPSCCSMLTLPPATELQDSRPQLLNLSGERRKNACPSAEGGQSAVFLHVVNGIR